MLLLLTTAVSVPTTMAQLYWASDQEYVLEYNKQPIVRAGEKRASAEPSSFLL